MDDLVDKFIDTFTGRDTYHVTVSPSKINDVDLYILLKASPSNIDDILTDTPSVSIEEYHKVLDIIQHSYGATLEISPLASAYDNQEGSLVSRLFVPSKATNPNDYNRKIAQKLEIVEKWDLMDEMYNPPDIQKDKSNNLMLLGVPQEHLEKYVQHSIAKMKENGFSHNYSYKT